MTPPSVHSGAARGGDAAGDGLQLHHWVQRFAQMDIPVLASTCAEILALAECQDDVDANGLGEIIAVDPLMTLKVLVHAAQHRPMRQATDLETVTSSLVMMGIGPFFRCFATLTAIENQLQRHEGALDGFGTLLARAHRASRFALGFAVHRGDHDAAAVHLAALLHDFADMLLWCDAPELALCISRRQAQDPTLRTAAAQHDVLGVTLPQVQHALMVRWKLPELLTQITDDRNSHQPQVRCVLLAVRLARHTAGNDWSNAAVPDDVRDIAALLNISPDAALELVREIDN